ncbi:unnamed protein product [Gongylonema pulchrum]|uniref:C2H2-type domain-containing protein n=1 Tax=Gongylonema pulchrum TaxID=637853 RepID=A0A183EJL6_9BILA|nr:unnamed protein product [Gongylonema pulchrum]
MASEARPPYASAIAQHQLPRTGLHQNCMAAQPGPSQFDMAPMPAPFGNNVIPAPEPPAVNLAPVPGQFGVGISALPGLSVFDIPPIFRLREFVSMTPMREAPEPPAQIPAATIPKDRQSVDDRVCQPTTSNMASLPGPSWMDMVPIHALLGFDMRSMPGACRFDVPAQPRPSEVGMPSMLGRSRTDMEQNPGQPKVCSELTPSPYRVSIPGSSCINTESVFEPPGVNMAPVHGSYRAASSSGINVPPASILYGTDTPFMPVSLPASSCSNEEPTSTAKYQRPTFHLFRFLPRRLYMERILEIIGPLKKSRTQPKANFRCWYCGKQYVSHDDSETHLFSTHSDELFPKNVSKQLQHGDNARD